LAISPNFFSVLTALARFAFPLGINFDFPFLLLWSFSFQHELVFGNLIKKIFSVFRFSFFIIFGDTRATSWRLPVTHNRNLWLPQSEKPNFRNYEFYLCSFYSFCRLPKFAGRRNLLEKCKWNINIKQLTCVLVFSFSFAISVFSFARFSWGVFHS